MKDCIAERTLLYSEKGSDEKIEFQIRIGTPHIVQQAEVDFEVDGETAACVLEVTGPFGIDEKTYGADLLQALQLSVDVDTRLRAITEGYEIYFPSGEQYFEG